MKKFLYIIFSIFISQKCLANVEYDVVFLSIGVENYATLGEKKELNGTREFSSPRSGKHSASRIAYQLSLRAKWGMMLSDDSERFITRNDVWSAVHETLSVLEKYDNPLLVLYYNGHGLGEGLGYGHFLVPGDFIGPYPIQDLVEAEEEQLVSVLGILDAIDKAKIPSLVLLDTCYEAESKAFNNTLVPEVEQLGQDVTNILKTLNSQYPAITASQPTSLASTVNDPYPKLSKKSIGPLARRFLMALERSAAVEVSVSDLITQILSETLDQQTEVPRAQPKGHKWKGALPKPRESIQLIQRVGSAKVPNFEILDRGVAEQKADVEAGQSTHFSLSEQPTYAKVSLVADSFGKGRPASSGQIDDPTDLVFTTTLKNAADFATGDSDVSSFSYDIPAHLIDQVPSTFRLHAFDRFDDKPGLGMSFRGTSCEVVKGEAKNVVVTSEDGVLQTLAMDFSIECLNGSFAEGTMDVVW